MESSAWNVLPAELCQRIYHDFVKRPRVPLSLILDFELYKVALFCVLPKDFYLHLSNNSKIRHWLNFKIRLTAVRGCAGVVPKKLRKVGWIFSDQ